MVVVVVGRVGGGSRSCRAEGKWECVSRGRTAGRDDGVSKQNSEENASNLVRFNY
jgi:hypothetical protein